MDRGVFLDRDGVLIEDRGLLVSADDIVVADGAPQALRRLKEAGFRLVVVSNQTVVARGLLDVPEVIALEREIERRIEAEGDARLFDGFYFCPHHPKANVMAYRQSCDCRKPAPGLLRDASAALGIDLRASLMVGDRPSDVLAGKRAGCRTIQLMSGRHLDAPIEVDGGFQPVGPDFICASWDEAAEQILGGGWA